MINRIGWNSLFRSMLFLRSPHIPSASTRPDWYILNLEDGIPTSQKQEQRIAIGNALQKGVFHRKPVCIRVNTNSKNPREFLDDLRYVIHQDVQALLLSKTSTVEQLQRCADLVSAAELQSGVQPGWMKFFVNIESPLGVLNAPQILAASPRNAAVAFGHADYLAESHGSNSPAGLHHAISHIAMAGQAAKLPIIASPWLRLNDMDTLKEEAQFARDIGFTGNPHILAPKKLKGGGR